MFKRMLLITCLTLIAGTMGIHNRDAYGADIRAHRAVPKAAIQRLQIPFVENVGQFDERVRFCARTAAGAVFVTDRGEIVYWLPSREIDRCSEGAVLREVLMGGEVSRISGEPSARRRVSHFRGCDRSQWTANIAAYDQLNLGEVYEGIEFRIRAHYSNVEKLLFVSPGADPSNIRIRVNGAGSLSVNQAGELVAQTELGTISFTKPVAFQNLSGRRKLVDVAYEVDGCDYGFAIGEYDRTETLVIDPLLASTFVGGSGRDGLYEVPSAIDDEGNIYVASITRSQDFPTTDGVYDDSLGGNADVFVAKLDADLTTVLACTYLGGSGTDGEWPGVALTLGLDGSVFVAGKTASLDFPYTTGVFDSTYDGGWDVFISRLDADLTNLIASTYLGGSGEERYVQMTTDPMGNICVAGATASPTFPFTPGVYDSTYNPGGTLEFDIFVSKFDPDLHTLLASTFLGGNGDDCNEVVLSDDEGNLYVTGWTLSPNYPTTDGAYDQSFNYGNWEAYISKLGGDLDTLLASTYLGGTNWDFGYSLALDEVGNIYVGGHTASISGDFPTTPGAYDESYNGLGIAGTDDDAFVSKFDNGLTTLIASTYLGGTGWEIITGILVGDDGYVYVAGNTDSDDFPFTPGSFDTSFGGGTTHAGDAVVARLDDDLTNLSFSTYLGGSNNEIIGSIRLDSGGNVYVSGGTGSEDFPVTSGSYDDDFNGGTYDWGGDIFLSIIPRGYWTDSDEDGIFDANDNCPAVYNPDQADGDGDEVGDSCDICDGYDDNDDADNDGIPDGCDECTDSDGDGYGDPGYAANLCPDDNCENDFNPDQEDSDGDMVGDSCDNCPHTYNPGQEDDDDDGIGNACEYVCGDADGSGEVDIDDAVYLIAYIFSGGPEPVPYEAGDADCSGLVDIDDVVYLINYIFQGGPPPCEEC